MLDPIDIWIDPYEFILHAPPRTEDPEVESVENIKTVRKEENRIFHHIRRFKNYTFFDFYRDNPNLRPIGFNPNNVPAIQEENDPDALDFE